MGTVDGTAVGRSQRRVSLEEGNIVIFPDNSRNYEETPVGNHRLSRDELMLSLASLPPIEPIHLSFFNKCVIASGHFLNDLCAALWFSYLLLYLQFVVGFNDENETPGTSGSNDSKYAAALLLIGQLIDGVATPLVGYEVDHSNIWPRNYGRCKSWHLWGSVMVLTSFPFIFSPIIGGTEKTASWVKLLYYAPFIGIFQIGWASVQVSHLALIPKMHPDELIRTELFSIRYCFTVIANMTIFIMTWLKLKIDELNAKGKACRVDTDDAYTFMTLALIAIGIGLISTILFHIGVKEEPDRIVKEKVAAINSRTDLIRRLSQIVDPTEIPQPETSTSQARRVSGETNPAITDVTNENPDPYSQLDEDEGSKRGLLDEGSVEVRFARLQIALQETEHSTQISVKLKASHLSTKMLNIGKEFMHPFDWFHLPQMYIVGFVYMTSRLSINLGQVYVPLYVQESLRIPCTSVATVPLTMYISGFLVSFIIKLMNKHYGRQISYSLGAGFAILGSLLILCLDWDGKHGGDSYILKNYVIYIVGVFLGAGASAILINSLSITADLIGKNIESGAFVYGTMSFSDKFSCGLTILLINSLVPCPGSMERPCKDQDVVFYRNVLAYSVGGCALAGVLGVLAMTYLIHFQHKTRQEELSRGPIPEMK